MPVPTLYELSKRHALRMMKTLDDLGDIPFRIAEPLLKKVQSPAQLHRLEQNCPQYIGHTRNIWIALFKRDLPAWDGVEPKNPASWHKLYQKLMTAETRATQEDALILKATMDKLAAEKGDRSIHTTNLLHKSHVRGARVAKLGQPADQSSLRFNSGSRTKMVTGKDVMARARREAHERSQALNNHSVLARPTHMLNQRATSVRRAPAGLVDSHQREQTSPTSQKPQSARPENGAQPRKMTASEREAKLKAINAARSTSQSQTPARPSSALPSTSQAVRAPRGREVVRKTQDELDDLFGDETDGGAGEALDDLSIKKRHVSPTVEANPTPPKRKANADVFLRKPVRKPGR